MNRMWIWIGIILVILLGGIAALVVVQRFQVGTQVAPTTIPVAGDRDGDGVDDTRDYYPSDASR